MAVTETRVRPERRGAGGKKGRLLTGDRPTGKPHLGHYVGSWENRLRLQEEYECFFLVADYHTLTTGAERTTEVAGSIRELVLDYLGIGIDPQKSTIYLQSLVPEVAVLHLIFSMLISVPRLQRARRIVEQLERRVDQHRRHERSSGVSIPGSGRRCTGGGPSAARSTRARSTPC